MAKGQALQPDTIKKELLAAYAEYSTVTSACREVGVSRQTWYDWKKQDEKFAEEVGHAEEAVADSLEAEAIRRARDGSDTLLIFLLKGLRPQRYKERFQHSRDSDQPVILMQLAFDTLPDHSEEPLESGA